MFEIIGSFVPPKTEDGDIKLWRYMDFTKFVYLLETCSLYFARCDTFEDQFEGATTKFNLGLRDWLRGLEVPSMPFKVDDIPDIRKAYKKCVSISCWHQSDYESAAMWNLYIRNGEGICIQTTYKRLEKSFTEPRKIYFGKVEYIDYETEDRYFSGGEMALFLLKRRGFEHEKEYRALIFNSGDPKIGQSQKEAEKEFEQTTGYSLECDLSILIENVYVSPSSPSWLKDLIELVLRRYQFNIIPRQSSLNVDPIF